jgi:hypothetical protein
LTTKIENTESKLLDSKSKIQNMSTTIEKTRKPRTKKDAPQHIKAVRTLVSAALRESWLAQTALERMEKATHKHRAQVEGRRLKAHAAWEKVIIAAGEAHGHYKPVQPELPPPVG